jgi:hypothetical protein
MAGQRRRVVIPPVNPNAAHAPGGKTPRAIDRSDLAALEKEEYALKQQLRSNKANSKRLLLKVPAALYRGVLALAEKNVRDPRAQLLDLLEIGLQYYEPMNTPRGAARPLDYLPEVRDGADTGMPAWAMPPAPISYTAPPNGFTPATTTGVRQPFTVTPIEPEIEEAPAEEPTDGVEVDV